MLVLKSNLGLPVLVVFVAQMALARVSALTPEVADLSKRLEELKQQQPQEVDVPDKQGQQEQKCEVGRRGKAEGLTTRDLPARPISPVPSCPASRQRRLRTVPTPRRPSSPRPSEHGPASSTIYKITRDDDRRASGSEKTGEELEVRSECCCAATDLALYEWLAMEDVTWVSRCHEHAATGKLHRRLARMAHVRELGSMRQTGMWMLHDVRAQRGGRPCLAGWRGHGSTCRMDCLTARRHGYGDGELMLCSKTSPAGMYVYQGPLYLPMHALVAEALAITWHRAV